MSDEQIFREWGILEVMGRLKMAGQIGEQTIAGAGMIRIDVPETKSAPAFTRFFSPGSIYSITPTSEEIARHLAEQWREVPVQRFEFKSLLPAATTTMTPRPGYVSDECRSEDHTQCTDPDCACPHHDAPDLEEDEDEDDLEDD